MDEDKRMINRDAARKRIRRPLYYIAMAFTLPVLLRFYWGWWAVAAAGIALAGAAHAHNKANTEDERRGPGAASGRSQRTSGMRLPLLLVIAFALSAGNLFLYDQHLARDPALKEVDRNAQFTGIIKEPSLYKDSRERDMLRIRTQIREINGRRVRKTQVLVIVPAESLAYERSSQGSSVLRSVPPGTVLQLSGTPELPRARRNPNTFDYRLYLKTCGIQTMIRTDAVRLGPGPRKGLSALQARLFLLREQYLERLSRQAGQSTADMLRAILFGDKSQLDEDVREEFQKNGTAHILAVSGLHVGMIYAAMTALWDLLIRLCPAVFGQRRGRRFFFCAAGFFGGYIFLAGYAPSVIRAVCMVLLHAFATMTGRRYDLSCAAFAVGIAALARNPYILFQTGFQMSFLAILTLSLISPYIHRLYTGVLAGGLAIQIGLGPYIMYQFNVVSLIAVFINVPVLATAGILVPAGMAGMLLPASGPVDPTGLYDTGLASLCRIMLRMNDLACVDPITSRTVASPPVWMIAAFYLGLLVFASEEGRRMILSRRQKLVCLAAAGVLMASLLFGQAADDGFRRMELVFVDVGQGDCMHLRSGGRNYLIDGGGSADYEVGAKTLQPYLLKNGVGRIDGAFVTHLHTDHYRGICELAKAGMIRRIYLYEANRLKLAQICEETGLAEENVVFLHQGETVRLPGCRFGGSRRKIAGKAEKDGSASLNGGASCGDTVQILWPPEKSDTEYAQMLENEEDENASSLILRVTLSGVSLLATGDLGKEGEEELLLEYGGETTEKKTKEKPVSPLQADILKIGHHGSKNSSSEAFLDQVRPSLCIIQVGENNMYGHPTPEVLQRLADRSIPVCRNDLQGAVGLKLRSGKIRKVKVMQPMDAVP